MPVVATPVQVRCLTREEVRRWLRDFPPGLVPGTGVFNSLLDGVEFSDEDVDLGIEMTVGLYNAMTPITHFDPMAVPKVLLMYGAVAHLLRSTSFQQIRNQSDAQDADVQPLGLDAKGAAYTQASDALMARFDMLARALKTQWNAERFYGGLSSGYLNTSRALYG